MNMTVKISDNNLKTENEVITKLEKAHVLKDYYIALDHANFDWLPAQVQKVEDMWSEGLHIKEIAKNVNRSKKDTFLLIYDRLELGYIKERKGGIFGRKGQAYGD